MQRRGLQELPKMQQQMGQLDEDLSRMRERLYAVEEERDRAFKELKEMKLAQDVHKSPRMISTGKAADIHRELTLVKESLANASQELKNKEKSIEYLRTELEKKKELEVKFTEKDAALSRLKQELRKARSSEAGAINLLSESEKRIQELQAEMERGKVSEAKLLDSFASQTKQLEEAKISLEESKLESVSLRRKLEKMEGAPNGKPIEAHRSAKEALENLKFELQIAKQNLARAEEAEKLSSSKAKSLFEEVSRLKYEMRLATEAEENSKKALDDLALALKEVATEANHMKEKLASTQKELEHTKGEVEDLRMKLKSTEEKYSEATKEADRYMNIAERLRLEAEESLLAWSGKEAGFVGCIRKAEDERDVAQEENDRLLGSLKATEDMHRKAKQETQKLRDILKQALNEANVAKEAAGIAREENSQLKDALSQKDEALRFLSRENESLKINEAIAYDNIRELKKLLSEASATKGAIAEDKPGDKNLKPENSMDEEEKDDKEQGKKLKPQHSVDKENIDNNKLATCFNLNLKELKLPQKHKQDAEEEHKASSKEISDEDDDSENCDPLKGSIFDVAETPESAMHHRKKSSLALTDDGEAISCEDSDVDSAHLDDSESDRSSRKKKALLRRFGDFVKGRSFHRREAAVE